MGSENSGNRELSYSFQNSKNREEAVIKLAEFKEREKRMERQSTVKIVDGREQIEEYYYSKTKNMLLLWTIISSKRNTNLKQKTSI